MRTLGDRLTLLRTLINLRCGPGAAALPPEVARIHMDFALKMDNGHMGPRKFWREYLPRLKYHNPAVPMIVNRHDQNLNPPVMTVYLRTAAPPPSDAAASAASQLTSSRTNLSKAQPPGPGERVVLINMKDKHSSEILEMLITETRARRIEPSRADINEIRDLEVMKKKAGEDRERMLRHKAERKKETDMLRRAKEAGALSEEEAA